MKTSFKLLFSFGVFILAAGFAHGQNKTQSFDQVLSFLYDNRLTPTALDSVFTLKKDTFIINEFKKDNDILAIKRTSNNKVKALYINNMLIDTILPGNTEFDLNLNDLDINDKSIQTFKYKNHNFFILYPVLHDCNGSFCRVFMCVLIGLDYDRKPIAFYFSNNELPNRFYFRVSKNDSLIYLDISNSFSDKEDFLSYAGICPDNKCILFKVEPLTFSLNKKTWGINTKETSNPYHIVFKADDQFETDNGIIIGQKWPVGEYNNQ